MPCPPLPLWRQKHMHASRVLFRYAAGLRSVRTTVPGWVVYCQKLQSQARKQSAPTPKRKDKHVDQLNHFKEGVNNLEFVDGGPNPKLEYLRQKLFDFYEEHPGARADMFDYYKTVYSTEPLTLLDIKLWLAKIYQAQPGPRALSRLPGVYHLARYGPLFEGQPTIVRSAMRIKRDTVGTTEFLSFELFYPTTAEQGSNEIERVAGIILGTLGHYYFIGCDEGSASAPYQLITKQHAQERSPAELSGILMRHSHNNEVLATRILILRVSADSTGDAPNTVYEDEFEQATSAVRVLLPNEISKDKHLNLRRLAKITNTIDKERAPALWLVSDDRMFPAAPPEQRSARPRPPRRN